MDLYVPLDSIIVITIFQTIYFPHYLWS